MATLTDTLHKTKPGGASGVVPKNCYVCRFKKGCSYRYGSEGCRDMVAGRASTDERFAAVAEALQCVFDGDISNDAWFAEQLNVIRGKR